MIHEYRLDCESTEYSGQIEPLNPWLKGSLCRSLGNFHPRIEVVAIVCSQYDPKEWIERLNESVVSYAILDRLLSKSYI